MKRILGLDYGEKRIGAAISDPLNMTAQPVSTLLNNAKIFDSLCAVIEEYNVQQIIMGLPLNSSGGDSPKCLEVRAFATQVSEHFSLPIDYWDERFSTAAVTRHLIEADVSRKKRKEIVDCQAAMFILQGYLDKENLS